MQLGYLVGAEVLHADRESLALAVGSRAELAVFDTRVLRGLGRATPVADLHPVAIVSTESSATDVIAIERVIGSRLLVHAARAGTAQLHVRTAEGEVSFSVQSATPAQVTLTHPQWGPGDPPLFVQSGTARFAMERRDAAGHALGGYGAAPPIHVDPPHAAELRVRDGDADRVDVLFHRAGPLVLRPLGGPAVALTVVDPQDVWGIGLSAQAHDSPDGRPFRPLQPGDHEVGLLRLWHEDGRRILGSIGLCQVTSLTPTLCSIAASDTVDSDGLYRIDALSEGECELEVRVGQRTLVESLAIHEPDPE